MSTATTLSFAVSVTAPTYGQPVTFTAALSWAIGFTGGSPIGTMTFKEGATVLGTAQVNASGQASLTLSTLAVGAHLITAEYSGDVEFLASSYPNWPISVALATTTCRLDTERHLPAGVPVSMAIVVALATPGTPVYPAGTVALFENAVNIGTATLNASGVGTITGVTLTAGTHLLTAVYNGNANAANSQSAEAVVVAMPPTSTDVFALETALQTWVKNALGLTTIWSSPNAAAPVRPYAWLTLVGPQTVGKAQLVGETQLANPAGQEVEFTAIQHQEWELSIDVVSEMTPGNSTASYLPTAAGMLTAAGMRLRLPSALAGLSAAGLAVIDFGDTQDLTALFNSAIESRARMTVRLRSVNTAMEKTGYIAKVGLSSPFGTWPQLPP